MTSRGGAARRPDIAKGPPGQRRARGSATFDTASAVTPEGERDERLAREERILDAAATLLMRWGYRKTTIDDVAREAGVGKGTIYLHWRDKNELFQAAIMRANQLLGQDIMRRIADDPQGGLPHRLWAHGMVAALENPLMAAIMKGQTDIFQGLLGGFDPQTREQLAGNATDYVVQLQRAGLIRADLPVSLITYMMAALKMGVVNAPDLVGKDRMPPLEQVTDAVSDMIRRWLEPERLHSESEAGKRLLADLLEKVQDIADPRESAGE